MKKILCLLAAGTMSVLTSCQPKEQTVEYNIHDLPMACFEIQYGEDAVLPFTMQTMTLPALNGGVPRTNLVDGEQLYFAVDYEEYAISSNDIALFHYHAETGSLTELFHHTDDTLTMRFAEMVLLDEFLYLIAYTETPRDDNGDRESDCAVWQMNTKTFEIRILETIHVDKSSSLRRALFPVDGEICFAYELSSDAADTASVTEKVYHTETDNWETIRRMELTREDPPYVADRDENFTCDESGAAAILTYEGSYRLVTHTPNALYVDGTASYVNWAEKITEGDTSFYYYYHFDAETKQLYRTKTDTLGYDICSAGDYVLLWRDSADKTIPGQTMWCLMPETGTLTRCGPAGYTAAAIEDDSDDLSIVFRDKRDIGDGSAIIGFITDWRS